MINWKSLTIGAIAGALATAPMTLAMAAMKRRLPREQQYPLPPRLITENIAETAGLHSAVSNENRAEAATLAGHFGYGAAVGSLYATTVPRREDSSLVEDAAKGSVFGLLVWGGSYLGWLPATGVLRSATHIPAERNLLMIAAHVVFGASLGVSMRLLKEKSHPFRRAP